MPPNADFERVFEQCPASVLLLCPDLTIVAASDSYLRDTLTVREDILGRDIFDVFPDDPNDPNATGVATLRASLHQVLAEHRTDTMAVQRYGIRRPASEGGGFEQRYWSPVNSPILDDAGELVLIAHQVMDVTDFVHLRQAGDAERHDRSARTREMEEEIFLRAQEIQQTNALLRASEERFRLLSRATSDAIWEWDLTTGEMWISDTFEDLVGYRPEEIPTIEAWRALIHPDDRQRIVAQHDDSIASGGDRWGAEYRLLHRSGSVVWAESRATVIRNDDGFALRVVGGTRDQTARKEAELQIRRQAELLDKASDAIVVRDLDDRITFWNAGAERLYGWSATEAIGRRDPSFRGHDPDAFAAAKATTVRCGEWSGEFRHHAKDGREVVVEARWTLLHNEHGHPEGVLVINTDVTERRRLESHYLRVQRMESIGTLAGGIAHDLNNVLTPILMALELLRKEVRSTRGREWIDILEASARRGADMVRQVLAFARGVEGRREPLRVDQIARDVIRLISDSFPKSIRISLDLDDNVHTVTGDPTQLHQVLLNLCVNARDAMPSGGELVIRVENVSIDNQYASMTASAEPGDYVVLHVVDSGVGIPATDVARIFEPFFTTKELGQGTGLGLATSDAIARSHGGFITAYSEPGRGTTIKVHLPATLEPLMDVEKNDIAVPRALPDETILIVEDETAVLQVTRHTLEEAGYRVLTASDGADGIAVYTSHRDEINLVLTDVMMPVMDGAALTAALRRVTPDVRIVVTSGLVRATGSDEAAAVGGAHFLPKPYTADGLLMAVRAALDSMAPSQPGSASSGA